MNRQPVVVSQGTRSRDLNIVGEIINVLADASQTHGPELFEQHGPEGAGPPPHTHPWDEAYFMVEGEMEVLVGERTVVMAAGGFVYIPAGTVHCFRFRAKGGKFVSFNSAAGAAKLFRELDQALPDGKIELDKFVPIAIANGVTLAGPSPA